METNGEELVELKEIYDELWTNAKTLVKDMRKSISMYSYAGFLTLLIGVTIGMISFVPSFLNIISGNYTILYWYNVIVGGITIVVTIPYGAKLLQVYRELKNKYSKLIEMEKNLEAK